MRSKIVGRVSMAALLLGLGAAGAATKPKIEAPLNDEGIARRLAHEINMYPYYTIWDAVSFQVTNGQVSIQGAVNQPFKAKDIERIVRNVAGVTSVSDEMRVLPLSPSDDRLRIQIARAIYGDPTLSRYAILSIPSIHILVDNGHVTLTGVVNNEMEKTVAGLRASGAGMSFGPLTNNLVVEHPAKKG